ncbi:acyl-CoA dehydrogenase family protein [Micromonospora maris]|uniref:Acyl-CoA dehydrogenase n=2 Tax=Micromonospora TaxID=1873 RepID=A0A9X0I233_9ACTN|nr:acyl-CoA dehydrogenase [Micromonospora maris]AEB46091.1 acyl-CoA dehydrogenase domain-containing protein [Micromonospora maris AB-18-032]AIS85489.1 acyl-CoA dehydrogenase domain-containing protein [Verrucosispora sp. MS100047]KUJ45375.1 acyl-CoA dehydrogenase [Micromonospora maris]
MSTDFLTDLRAQARAHADLLRPTALDLDRNPDLAVSAPGCGLPWRRFAGLPAEYNPDPLRVDGRPVLLDTCVERVVVLEELARADAAAVLALPGPSMSASVIADLADDDQQQRYWETVATEPTWTFFAMTEPAHGSDPGSMHTTLRRHGDDFRLHGTKRYVGNGVRSRLGVVFARRNAGPLGVVAVLVDTDLPGFTAAPLSTLGLRGLQLSELRMVDVPLTEADILGRQRSATRQGMWAATRTFNRYRPVVSCLALGVAQAAYDLVVTQRRRYRTDERHLLTGWEQRLAGTRALVLAAARAVDADPRDGTLAAAAKLRATRLAEEITTTAVRLLGPGARWEHPMLDKLLRDARAFEFMEGTGNIQRLTLAEGYLQGRLTDVRAG